MPAADFVRQAAAELQGKTPVTAKTAKTEKQVMAERAMEEAATAFDKAVAEDSAMTADEKIEAGKRYYEAKTALDEANRKAENENAPAMAEAEKEAENVNDDKKNKFENTYGRTMIAPQETEKATRIIESKKKEMSARGKTVTLSNEDIKALNEFFPNLRSMKKEERNQILSKKNGELKEALRNMLNRVFGGQNVEFSINGNIIEARLYRDGIDHVLSKLTQRKSAIIKKTEEIFKKAEYIYSSPNDEHNKNPDIEGWDYLYVPMNLPNETSGVKISVLSNQRMHENQIHDWGEKKTPLDGARRPIRENLNSVQRDVSLGVDNTIPHPGENSKPTTENGQQTEKPQSRGEKLSEAQRGVTELGRKLGVEVDFVNGLSEGFDGKYQNGRITISTESETPERAIFIHELTHHLEQAGEYQKLSDLILDSKSFTNELAKNGTDINELERAVMEDYAARGIELNEDGAKREIVAMYAADKLFTSDADIQRLVRKDRSLGQRILDWLKDIGTKITGTREEKFILDAQKKYEKALRGVEAGQGGEAQYLVKQDANGKPFVEIQEDILDGVSKEKWAATAAAELAKRFPNGIDIGNWNIAVNSIGRGEFTHSNDTQRLANHKPSLYADKMRSAANADEIVQNAYGLANEDPKHPRKDNLMSFNRGNIDIRVGGRDYNVEVVTGIRPDTSEIFYDFVNMTPTKITEAPSIGDTAQGVGPQDKSASTDTNIPQDAAGVNSQYMQGEQNDSQRDVEYSKAVASGDTETAQRLVDEAAREAGYTIRAYHGTSAEFTVFDKGKVGSNYGADACF